MRQINTNDKSCLTTNSLIRIFLENTTSSLLLNYVYKYNTMGYKYVKMRYQVIQRHNANAENHPEQPEKHPDKPEKNDRHFLWCRS